MERTGPDLARVGGKYSNEWHIVHLLNPRDVVPESIMPAYRFLAEQTLEPGAIAAHLRANQAVGVPYSDEMIAGAAADFRTQADPAADNGELLNAIPAQRRAAAAPARSPRWMR